MAGQPRAPRKYAAAAAVNQDVFDAGLTQALAAAIQRVSLAEAAEVQLNAVLRELDGAQLGIELHEAAADEASCFGQFPFVGDGSATPGKSPSFISFSLEVFFTVFFFCFLVSSFLTTINKQIQFNLKVLSNKVIYIEKYY